MCAHRPSVSCCPHAPAARSSRREACASVCEHVCVMVTSHDPSRVDRSDSPGVAYLQCKLRYGQADYTHFEVSVT